jgi:hypothetical protein
MNNDQPLPVAPETIEIPDLDQFVTVLVGWHEQKVKMLEHMLQLPTGTEMTVGDDAATTLVLQGEALAGFKAGVEISLMELGILPFVYEREPEPVAVTDAA